VGDALVVAAAADDHLLDGRHVVVLDRLVGPDLLPGRGVEREDVVVAVGDEHPAIDDDRVDLQLGERVQHPGVETPRRAGGSSRCHG